MGLPLHVSAEMKTNFCVVGLPLLVSAEMETWISVLGLPLLVSAETETWISVMGLLLLVSAEMETWISVMGAPSPCFSRNGNMDFCAMGLPVFSAGVLLIGLTAPFTGYGRYFLQPVMEEASPFRSRCFLCTSFVCVCVCVCDILY